MEDEALSWFQWMCSNNLIDYWKAFLDELKLRFGSSPFTYYKGALAKLKHLPQFQVQSQFEDLYNYVSGLLVFF